MAPTISAAVSDAIKAQLGFTPPAALAQVGQELAWLSEVSGANGKAGGKPFATVVHCLCLAP